MIAVTKKKEPHNLRTITRSAEEWDELISLFEESGLRQVDFCAEMGLDPKGFSYRIGKRRRANAPDPAASWVEAKPAQAAPATTAKPAAKPCIVVRAGGCEVEVRPGFDAALLRDVCRALSCHA